MLFMSINEHLETRHPKKEERFVHSSTRCPLDAPGDVTVCPPLKQNPADAYACKHSKAEYICQLALSSMWSFPGGLCANLAGVCRGGVGGLANTDVVTRVGAPATTCLLSAAGAENAAGGQDDTGALVAGAVPTASGVPRDIQRLIRGIVVNVLQCIGHCR